MALDKAHARTLIVAFAKSQLGKPYSLGIEIQPGQEQASDSWDCSELVEAAYRAPGLKIPDGSNFQYDFCIPFDGEPLPGDLGFLYNEKWKRIGHVWICADPYTLIHAVGGRGVVVDHIKIWDSNPRFRGWRRHPQLA